MARPRTFEPDKALDAVTRVFWQRGYSKTSYDDLVKASSVSRKGLYTAFGDKEALFIASLRHYRQTVFVSVLSDLEKEGIGVNDIATMMVGLGQLAVSERGSWGCLMANTAATDALRMAGVKSQVEAHLKAMSQSFADAFKRAGLSSSRAKALGDYFTGVMQGLFLLAHARASEDMIENYIAIAIATI